MCIICLELQKGLLTPFEATRNLTEMVEQIDEDHLQEVFEIIMLQEEQEFCEYCDCNPCDCSWGED
jgi:hypothetical protein